MPKSAVCDVVIFLGAIIVAVVLFCEKVVVSEGGTNADAVGVTSATKENA